jgi:hypothetical protein
LARNRNLGTAFWNDDFDSGILPGLEFFKALVGSVHHKERLQT